jgi:thioredoxin-like negative regulator of GroEL
MITITDKNADDVIAKTEGTLLIKFWATWCGPCKGFKPVFESLEGTEGVTLAEADIEECQELASTLGVMGVPAVIVFRDGNPIGGLPGVQTAERLRKLAKED